MQYQLRKATPKDCPQIERLIARSIRALGAIDYTTEQVEAALGNAFGVDMQLIADGTYFVVESSGEIVGCGGWSHRRALFGASSYAERESAELNPATDAARIRAFFVDPAHARRGIGTLLLTHCETEARNFGFNKLELMATLPGVRLYSARGYTPSDPVEHHLTPELTIQFVPMTKHLAAEGR
jgi:N-acetylglutamate synthase-like GNAT family acetyltransferase